MLKMYQEVQNEGTNLKLKYGKFPLPTTLSKQNGWALTYEAKLEFKSLKVPKCKFSSNGTLSKLV
jgi:hypothetical protein